MNFENNSPSAPQEIVFGQSSSPVLQSGVNIAQNEGQAAPNHAEITQNSDLGGEPTNLQPIVSTTPFWLYIKHEGVESDTTSYLYQKFDRDFQHQQSAFLSLSKIGNKQSISTNHQENSNIDNTSYYYNKFTLENIGMETAFVNIYKAGNESNDYQELYVAEEEIQTTNQDNTSFFYSNYNKDVSHLENTYLNTISINNVTEQQNYGNNVFAAASFHKLVAQFSEYSITPKNKLFENNIFTSTDWMVGVVVLSLFLLAWIRTYYNKYLKRFAVATINYREAYKIFDEKSSLTERVSIILESIFFINISLFIFQLFGHFQVKIFPLSDFTTFFVLVGGLVGLFFVKKILILIIGYVSKTQSNSYELSYNTSIYNKMTGLLLFPIIISIPFISEHSASILVNIGIAVIIINYVIRIFREAKIFMLKHVSIFFSILYLCTVEILPVLLGIKIISNLSLS